MTRHLTLLKRLASKHNIHALGLLVIPFAVSMTACTSQVDLTAKEDQLASRDTTMGHGVVNFPDSVPSVYDGGVYWKQAACASCHGETGSGVAGKCDVDLTNAEWMRRRKPVDQYKIISFGTGREYEQPVTSSLGPDVDEHAVSEKFRTVTHEAYLDKLSKRQRWDLVFYSRSLAVPLLSEEERSAIKVVFGSNCAVCHGSRGAGDGELNKGLVLQPAPANFTQFDRFYDRTDEQIWDHIAHGIKWEGMPEFLGKQDRANKVTFDADYIWKLTQYVRNFHEDGEPALESPQKARLLDNNGSIGSADKSHEAQSAKPNSQRSVSTKIEDKSAADQARLTGKLDRKDSVQ